MKILKTAGKIVKPLVNVPAWLGLRYLTINFIALVHLLKDFFIPTKSTQTAESFEDTLIRLNLTEETVATRIQQYKITLGILLIIGLLILIYAIHLLMDGHLRGFFVSLAILGIDLAQAFHYHFWIFQMRNRKLGCTFKEWLYHFKG